MTVDYDKIVKAREAEARHYKAGLERIRKLAADAGIARHIVKADSRDPNSRSGYAHNKFREIEDVAETALSTVPRRA